MRLYVLGAGTPTPTPDRYGSAYVVELGDERLMFDCGPAATHKLVKAGLFPTQIDHLFFYHRIKEDLTLQVRAGSWRPGQEIPSEVELCRHYDVSRGTIRRAIAELVQQGLVYRRQGSGSFVSQPKLEGSVLGSYRQYRKEGVPFDVDARVLRCERRPAPPEIGRILGIEAEEAVYEVERVRFVQRRPVSLQVSSLPARLCPDLESRDLGGAHFYDVLQREYGTIFLRAEEFVEPILADDYVAEQLRVSRGSPLFLVERHSYTFDDRVGEFRRAHVRGDLYRYRIDLR